MIIILFYKDCKSWFDKGYNTSGVYTITPDGQNPLEVKLQLYITSLYNLCPSLNTGLL